jgi:large subunit ribosomal protein L29
MNKKLERVREMTAKELNDELTKKKTELFNLRFQHVIGQLENPMKLRETRKEIAQILTMAKEKELKAEKVVG